jgi:hypothetical protein
MKFLRIQLCAAGNRLSARYLLRSYANVREIKYISKLAMQRVVILGNGVHVSVYWTTEPAFDVVPRCVDHLKGAKCVYSVIMFHT